jgi:hypothetical protein
MACMKTDWARTLEHAYRQAFAQLCNDVESIRVSNEGYLTELAPDLILQLPSYEDYGRARNAFAEHLKKPGNQSQSVSAGV